MPVQDTPNRQDASRRNYDDSSILQQADAIAGHSRSRDYGHPYHNHRRIAQIWNVQAEHILGEGQRFTPELVALMMMGLKLARLANSPRHEDSVVDICGYAKCWDMIRKYGDAQAG